MDTRKYIIYGLGQVFRNNQYLIENIDVVAYCDKAPKTDSIDGIPVVWPEQLSEFVYDYILVFSNKLYSSIRLNLIKDYDVNPVCVVSWQLLAPRADRNIMDYFVYLSAVSRELGLTKLLDQSRLDASDYLYVPQDAGLPSLYRETPWNDSLSKVYVPWKGEPVSAVLVDDISKITDEANYLLSILDERDLLLHTLKERFAKAWNMQFYFQQVGVFVYLTPCKQKSEKSSGRIYVVTHKNAQLLGDATYETFRIGVSDQTGEQIAHLNPIINELTALYGIWKGAPKESAYIGLCHYRRYFYASQEAISGSFLSDQTIMDVFEKDMVDVILSEVEKFFDTYTVKEQLQKTLSEEAFSIGYEIILRTLKENQPEYVKAFHEAMQSRFFFPCNMFVARPKVMDAYCTWLFSFLIEAAEAFAKTAYYQTTQDTYNKRVIGFFGERMWSVWLRNHPEIRVREWPKEVMD